jgi:uncharacterized protein (TIGR01777 family)
MKALVTGGTGFVGSELLKALGSGRCLTRDVDKAKLILGPSIECFSWDPLAGPPPNEAFEDVEVVFHLMGESIGEGRWNAAKKERIRTSRIDATRNLVAGLKALQKPPRVLVAASAVGLYGDRGDDELDESSPPGSDFLADLCVEWEEAARKASELGIRVVHMRSGIVLGHGGPLPKMLLPFKLFAGGPLGNGRQWMPWIHLADTVGLMLFVAGNDEISGPVGSVAPGAVTNARFSRTLGKVLHRPAFMPAPEFMLRLVIGEFAGVLFDSQKVMPRAALAAGYSFKYPDLEGALTQILK